MRERPKKKQAGFYGTLRTVLVTLLLVAIVWVISLAWNTLGKKTCEVSYTIAETGYTGSAPATRKFEPGDEVVVRAAELELNGKKIIGWRDTTGVVDYVSDVFKNGTVFIMPEDDVVFEAVWEEETEPEENDDSTTSEKDDGKEIFYISAGKDYVNVRDNHGYDSKVIAKISDSSTKIEYSGKYEEVYDEDEEKSYDWYYVSIPSKDIKGWIRSDLLSKSSGSSSSSEKGGSSSSGEKYLKSHKYDVALMYKEADSSSGVVEKIEDEETIFYFNNKSEDVTDDNGTKTTWYYVKNSSSGKSGWVDSKRLEHVTD